jgi:hypothetical protein
MPAQRPQTPIGVCCSLVDYRRWALTAITQDNEPFNAHVGKQSSVAAVATEPELECVENISDDRLR